jgi:hypothetical protein
MRCKAYGTTLFQKSKSWQYNNYIWCEGNFSVKTMFKVCWIWCSYSYHYGKYGFLGCSATYFGRGPTFRRNPSPATLGWKCKRGLPPAYAGFSSTFNTVAICFSGMSGFFRIARHYPAEDHIIYAQHILNLVDRFGLDLFHASKIEDNYRYGKFSLCLSN